LKNTTFSTLPIINHGHQQFDEFQPLKEPMAKELVIDQVAQIFNV